MTTDISPTTDTTTNPRVMTSHVTSHAINSEVTTDE